MANVTSGDTHPIEPRAGSSGRSEPEWLGALVVVLLVVGVVLRTIPMVWPPAFASGDLAMARNITERSLERLMSEPPAWSQTAAPGYFLLQKLLVSLLGPSAWVLRLIPFASAVAALFLTAHLAREFVGRWGQVIAVALMATGVPFLVFGTHVRPFGALSVAASLAVLALGLTLLCGPLGRREAVRSGSLIVLLLVVSQMAALASTALAITLLVDAALRRDSARLRIVLALVVVWGSVATLVHFAPSMSAREASAATLRAVYAAGYPPTGASPWAHLEWIWMSLQRSFGAQQFHFAFPAAFTVATVVGGIVVWRTHQRAALLLILPALVGIAATYLGLYPFERYVLLWFTPCLLVLIGAAVGWGAERVPARASWLATIWALAWLVDPAHALVKFPPPHRIQEMPTALAYLRDHRQTGDAIYAFAGARHAMAFYGPAFAIERGAYVPGRCHAGDVRAYLEELDQFRGRQRVWLVITWDSGREGARQQMTQYLQTIGLQRDSLAITPPAIPPFVGGAWLYLYDLSDASRLALASAQSLPLPPGRSTGGRDPCMGGPLADETP